MALDLAHSMETEHLLVEFLQSILQSTEKLLRVCKPAIKRTRAATTGQNWESLPLMQKYDKMQSISSMTMSSSFRASHQTSLQKAMKALKSFRMSINLRPTSRSVGLSPSTSLTCRVSTSILSLTWVNSRFQTQTSLLSTT